MTQEWHGPLTMSGIKGGNIVIMAEIFSKYFLLSSSLMGNLIPYMGMSTDLLEQTRILLQYMACPLTSWHSSHYKKLTHTQKKKPTHQIDY